MFSFVTFLIVVAAASAVFEFVFVRPLIRVTLRNQKELLHRWESAGRPEFSLFRPDRWFTLAELFRPPRSHRTDRQTDAAYWAERVERHGLSDISPSEARRHVDAMIAAGRIETTNGDVPARFKFPPAVASLFAEYGDMSVADFGLHLGPGVTTPSADGRWLYLGGDGDGLVVAVAAEPGDVDDRPADTVFVTDGLGDRPYEPIAVADSIDHFLYLAVGHPDGAADTIGDDWEPLDLAPREII
ncbi:MAG: hypothetical protein AAGJ97_00275 [Planctomycetota bacterium]